MATIYDAAWWIHTLRLTRHPEGGAFRETYRSELVLPKSVTGDAYQGDCAASTCIYFLLEPGDISAFHRIVSDEIWHFYSGDPLIIWEIDQSGRLSRYLLGNDIAGGASFQYVIRGGSWFASEPASAERGYSLCGCTVAPGFSFADFELAEKNTLSSQYPEHAALINRLTR